MGLRCCSRLGTGPLVAALLVHGGSSGDPCECLNWRRSYESGIVRCGEGVELYTASRKTNLSRWERWDYSSIFHETCYTVYERIDGNACVNVQSAPPPAGEWDVGQWCYVPRECSSLGGGHPVASRGLLWSTPRNVSWKVCAPERDASLRSLDPQALLARAREWAVGAPAGAALDLSGLARRAWPGLRTRTWWQLQDAWLSGDVASLPEELGAALEVSQSVVVEFSEHRRGEAMVLSGSQLWYLQHNPWDCPDTTYCLLCKSGCPEDAPAPAEPAPAEPAAEALPQGSGQEGEL